MARKKQRKKSQRSTKRYASDITNRRLLRARFYIKDEPINDLRRYTPHKNSLTLDGNNAEITISPKETETFKHQTKAKIRYADPLRTTICIRRKVRRSVLFAKKKTGKGKTVSPIRRLTQFSKIKC